MSPKLDQRDQYRNLCGCQASIPLFSRDWWLDAAVGPEGWGVTCVARGEELVATLPYAIRERYGLIALTMPPLTQTLGPWLRPSAARTSKVLAEQKDLMQALIDQLPPFDLFHQNWHYRQTNWLPFYWRGFSQTTRYTYILPDLRDEEKLWAGLQENIRTDIRKADGRFRLAVRSDLGLDAFLRLNALTFARQGRELPYTAALVRRIDAACQVRGCRQIWIAEDADGRHHAGVYVVWDENSAYYLLGGADPELRGSGATSLCLWHAIRHASTVTRSFDFEGSMIEPVERFFRGFGATQTPYFSVSKTPSRLLRMRDAVARVISGS